MHSATGDTLVVSSGQVRSFLAAARLALKKSRLAAFSHSAEKLAAPPGTVSSRNHQKTCLQIRLYPGTDNPRIHG
jgi:hypothetical protein